MAAANNGGNLESELSEFFPFAERVDIIDLARDSYVKDITFGIPKPRNCFD